MRNEDVVSQTATRPRATPGPTIVPAPVEPDPVEDDRLLDLLEHWEERYRATRTYRRSRSASTIPR